MIRFCIIAAAALASAGCATNVVRLPAGDVVLTETMVVGPESSGKVFRGASDGSTRTFSEEPVAKPLGELFYEPRNTQNTRKYACNWGL